MGSVLRYLPGIWAIAVQSKSVVSAVSPILCFYLSASQHHHFLLMNSAYMTSNANSYWLVLASSVFVKYSLSPLINSKYVMLWRLFIVPAFSMGQRHILWRQRNDVKCSKKGGSQSHLETFWPIQNLFSLLYLAFNITIPSLNVHQPESQDCRRMSIES